MHMRGINFVLGLGVALGLLAGCQAASPATKQLNKPAVNHLRLALKAFTARLNTKHKHGLINIGIP
ncbi:hypothetical protein IMAU40007_01848 [Lactiplantibacillus plantarum]|nr:hypothetical protein [Lactiplantibacillus plantarum]MCG0604487.1 hypothetical protein [Lactiplantibacillus plantarum]MCG0742132.1 hypothetical protein [Lactiplantibacillus plantarum]MCG0929375.1 hypothetical protein [Lactiplantibacillus plantarum]MCG0932417.1 hypothetical protein [Lactiplantibacillus plantarum]